jgi:hypothetical protein
MGDWLPFLIFGVIAFLVVAGIAWGIYAERKRTSDMRQVADQLGLPFFDQGDPALIDALSSFSLFSQGSGRRIRNMIHGDTEQVDVGIFDYQYTTGSGKNSTTWRQSVICFFSPQLNLPQFALRPENLFDKLGGVLGFTDIDFDTHPAFSKTYLLRGANEEAVRQLFGSDVLSHFESLRGVNVEGAGNRFVFFGANRRIKPAEVREFMAEGFKIFGLFKS